MSTPTALADLLELAESTPPTWRVISCTDTALPNAEVAIQRLADGHIPAHRYTSGKDAARAVARRNLPAACRTGGVISVMRLGALLVLRAVARRGGHPLPTGER